jgi:hypothetical protein
MFLQIDHTLLYSTATTDLGYRTLLTSTYLHTYMVLSTVQRTASTGMHPRIEARTQPQTALPS